MNNPKGLALELYVATPIFPDKDQYMDSEIALALIKGREVEKGMRIVPLFNLEGQEKALSCVNGLGGETELPFLVRIYHDETGIVLGDCGLEEVIDALSGLNGCVIVTIYDIVTGNTSTYYPNQQH